MEAIKKKKAFGTFDHKPVLDLEKRIIISENFNKILKDRKLVCPTVAVSSSLHVVTIGRIKNITKAYTQTVFDKLLVGLNMTEKDFFNC